MYTQVSEEALWLARVVLYYSDTVRKFLKPDKINEHHDGFLTIATTWREIQYENQMATNPIFELTSFLPMGLDPFGPDEIWTPARVKLSIHKIFFSVKLFREQNIFCENC